MAPDVTLWYVAGAAVLLSIERLCYVWIWRNPDTFQVLTARLAIGRAREPVVALRTLFVAFKLLQAVVFIGWCLVFGRGALWPVEADAGVVALAVAAMLAGQALNVGVFLRLGQVGVFYGNKFGYRVPWCCGFPFSLCADPQYVGTVLSIWGFFLVMRFPHGDWFILPTLETVYYALGARLEREGGALGVSGDDEDERALSDC